VPSRPPGTIPVYGAVRIRVVPVGRRSTGAQDPSIVTLNLTAAAVPGSQIRQVVQDVSSGNFRVILTPFDLVVLTQVDVTGGGFGFEDTSLPTSGPNGSDLAFDVPESGCAYVGRVTFTYRLLPDTDSLTQLSIASDLAAGGSLDIWFTSAGTFVYLPDDPQSHRIEVPERSDRPPEARSCPVSRATFRVLAP
jgi:hypothetical protein